MNQYKQIRGEVDLQSEEQLAQLLGAAYTVSEASTQLRGRVANLATQHEARTKQRSLRRKRIRTGLGLAGATAMLLLIAIAWPKLVAAQVMRHMEAAVNDVKSAHVVSWQIAPDGSRSKQGELWYQNGQWRIVDEQRHRIQIFTNGKLWTYEPQADKVTVISSKGPFAYTPSGFSVASMMSDYTRWGWKDKFGLLNDTIIDGRKVHQVSIESSNPLETSRVLMLVDVASDLPLRHEITVRAADGRELKGVSDYTFNSQLEAQLFDPKFPASARIFDQDKGKAAWQQKLARGIEARQVGGRTIVMRDIQVNADGHVFLLYTAGRKYLGRDLAESEAKQLYEGQDWSVDIADALGTKYTKAGETFQPVSEGDYRMPSPPPNGYVFKGERLEGEWYIPLVPQHSWQPRSFTVTFHVSPVKLQGKLWKTAVKNFSQTAVFKVKVSRPASTSIPDYMPYMSMGPQSELDVLSAAARARAYYNHYMTNNPRQAVEQYMEFRRLTAAKARQYGYPITEDWHLTLDIAGALAEVGRKSQARAEIERAIQAPNSENHQWNRWVEVAGAYQKLNDKVQAQAMWNKAIEQCDDPQQQQWLRKQLDSMQ